MNNKLITFALLKLTASATEAASDCVDDITNQFKAAKELAESEAAKLEQDRLALVAVRDTQNTTYLKYKTDSDSANTDTTAFITKMTERQNAWTVEEEKRLAAVAAIAAGATELSTLAGNLTTATETKDATVISLGTAQTELDASELNVTNHTTEKAAMIAVFDTATETLATKTGLYDTALAAWNKATEDKTGCQAAADPDHTNVTHPCAAQADGVTTVEGTERAEAKAVTAVGVADGLVTNYQYNDGSNTKTEPTWATELKTANVAKIKKTAEKTQYDAAVAGATYTTANTNDGVKTREVTASTLNSGVDAAATTANTKWEAARDALQLLVADAAYKLKVKVALATADTDQEGVISPLLSAKNTASDNKGTAASDLAGTPTTNKDLAIVHYDNAVIEKVNAEKIRDALAVKLRADQDAEFVANYLWSAKNDLKVDETAKNAAAELELINLLALKNTAEDTGNRSQARLDFYKGFTDTAKTALDATDDILEDVVEAKDEATGRATAAQASFDAAVEVCKHRRYAEAMEALAAATLRAEQAATASADLKTQYDKDAARGTSCFKDAEGVRANPCEGEGACCGQANKYGRDGTRHTIEVCGTTEQRSYTYWPEFVTGMEKAPDTEEWRYYCLTGARFLSGAAATFALAVFMQ